ncbi:MULTISPECIES: PLP-dependent aminotransferase family protein [unclassified Sinorhizobium]|uniref:aminotransferase-like domain-containing protein n=1 Tax=unclassified Sinorhizobium TaxID=2613772 RepID=UPI0024C398A4|nr:MULTISPECIES: PLP-dependent aminotransferase family protein [unclassified Sinorhizobium]MDK1376795.1 PLP-dependent aminotransferase family protein [Sinorhizobium sp. 6-70]MDK1479566.1 PLP-dependent aminotransferase family protein [Sinorhizobium sp. 6-117]
MKYLGIVEALEADIRTGRVMRGDRLPAQRAIAEALGVDLTTVTRAFNEARRRGLVAAQAGRGTFISERIDDGVVDQPQPLLDLSMNIPPQPSAVDFRKIFPSGIAGVLGSSKGLLHLHYQESTGAEPDRTAAATWLAHRIEGVTPDRIVVTGGAQCALFGVCELLLQRGDLVAAGAMTYPGLKAIGVQKGLILEALDMDEEGIVPDSFEKVCGERSPKAVYIVPSIDNPTTSTLPEARRRALVSIARKHGVAIIEDDPYAPLRAERIPAVAELAPDITWHIATLSKCSTPALRVAYVVAPSAAKALRFAAVLRASILMAPPLMTALVSRWISEGTLEEITRLIRAENAERQKLASTILEGSNFAGDPNGHHLWLHLPDHWRASDFAAHADRVGISIVPSSAFAIVAHPVEAVRISLGVAPDRGDLEDGLILLASLISQPPLGTKAVV